jgi:endonuclease III-like uncharacterized protein
MNFKEKLKYYLSLIWKYNKQYWYVATLLIFIIISVLLLGKSKQATDLVKYLEERSKQNRKDLEDLVEIHRREIEKRQRTETQYQETLKRISEQHTEALKQLDREKKEEMKRLIDQFDDDPDKMAESINNLLGIPIQKP